MEVEEHCYRAQQYRTQQGALYCIVKGANAAQHSERCESWEAV